MLANDEDDLEEATATCIFDSVSKFYIGIVNTIFPFHDNIFQTLLHSIWTPALRESWSSSYVCELAIRVNLMADEHTDALIAEFQDYQLTPDDEQLLYSAESHVDIFLAEMANKKTFPGGMRFPHSVHCW